MYCIKGLSHDEGHACHQRETREAGVFYSHGARLEHQERQAHANNYLTVSPSIDEYLINQA